MEPNTAAAEAGKQKNKTMLREALVSASFIEKTVILILTALSSGLLIPYVGDKIQESKAQHEALAQAKTKLLDDITNTLVTYQYLAGDVSYYKGDTALASDKLQAMAFERYSNKVVDLMAQWGVEIAKAKTLASPEVSAKLEKFMNKVLNEQEVKLVSLYTKNASVSEWAAMNDLTGKMYEEAKTLITELAVDLKLASPESKLKP